MKDTHDSAFNKDAAKQDYDECIVYYNEHSELHHPRSLTRNLTLLTQDEDREATERALRAIRSVRYQQQQLPIQFEQPESD